MTSTGAQGELHGRPMPWDYKEEPDIVQSVANCNTFAPPAGPAETPPAPPPPNGQSTPWSYYGHPWDYQEEPDIEGGAS